MPSPRVVAALGSSFAAGPGLPPYEDASAMRSTRNYAHRLAASVGARLVDLTVSGATTAHVLDTPQQALDGTVFPPQLDGVPADADLVTVTVGGNDLQYMGALMAVALRHEDPASPFLAMLGESVPRGIPDPGADTVAAATDGLVRVVERTRQRAPSARVVLVDYLTVVGGADADRTPYTPDELTRLQALERAVARVFRDAATATGADLLAASTLSADHGLGSARPWVQPFSSDPARVMGSFHPSDEGMLAVAEELRRTTSA